MKIPAIAALLNLFPGVGYLYLNVKRLFGWIVFISSVLFLASLFGPAVSDNTAFTIWDWFSLLSTLLLVLAFVVDGYREAQRMNTQSSTPEETMVTEKTGVTPSRSEAVLLITPRQRRKGIMVSLVAIPVGIIAWGILWNYGFMASIVSFGIARFVLYLYAKTTGSKPDRTAANALLTIIIAGVVVSFLTGIAMDAQLGYSSQYHVTTFSAYTRLDFWAYFLSSLLDPSILGHYVVDMIIAAIFAILGCYDILRDLARIATHKDSHKTVESNG